MNKQNLWFITLLSIILILCDYYITIPDSILNDIEPTITSNDAIVNTEEVSNLVALRVSKDEEVMQEIKELQNIIVDKGKTIEEINTAYEELKQVNYNKGREEDLETIIKEEFNYDSYIKINNNEINIVINNKEHNKEIANNIIRRIQKEFNDKKYITVKFQ